MDLDREPVNVDESGGLSCQGLVQVRTLAAELCTHWSRSRALLDTHEQDSIAVIQTGGDEGMDEGLCNRVCE